MYVHCEKYVAQYAFQSRIYTNTYVNYVRYILKQNLRDVHYTRFYLRQTRLQRTGVQDQENVCCPIVPIPKLILREKGERRNIRIPQDSIPLRVY